MTLQQTLARLKALGEPKVAALANRKAAGEHQFGVQLGAIRKLAKEIKRDHELALQLWGTGNADARLLAILLLKPKQLGADELDAMVRAVRCEQVADWLNAYVVKQHPDKRDLRLRWMADDDPMAARAGWVLTSECVRLEPESLDLPTLLDRIEAELVDAAPVAQWTMNITLATLGIHHAEHRERALAIGEALGVYRDYPTSKGCTSPFAPSWIEEMVKRQE